MPDVTPLPSAAAEPLSLLHACCFPDDPWDATAFARILGLSGVFGYVVWQGGEPAGFVVARDLGDEGEILSIGVLPGARRRGLGRALLDTMIAEVRQRRIGSIVLEVAADNEAARRLYGAAGFGQVGRRPRYYRRRRSTVDALIMRLGIGGDPDKPSGQR